MRAINWKQLYPSLPFTDTEHAPDPNWSVGCVRCGKGVGSHYGWACPGPGVTMHTWYDAFTDLSKRFTAIPEHVYGSIFARPQAYDIPSIPSPGQKTPATPARKFQVGDRVRAVASDLWPKTTAPRNAVEQGKEYVIRKCYVDWETLPGISGGRSTIWLEGVQSEGSRDAPAWEYQFELVSRPGVSSTGRTPSRTSGPPETPDWMKSRAASMAPGECPCGIKREQCAYHRPQTQHFTGVDLTISLHDAVETPIAPEKKHAFSEETNTSHYPHGALAEMLKAKKHAFSPDETGLFELVSDREMRDDITRRVIERFVSKPFSAKNVNEIVKAVMNELKPAGVTCEVEVDSFVHDEMTVTVKFKI